jgi:hypothetical protein
MHRRYQVTENNGQNSTLAPSQQHHFTHWRRGVEIWLTLTAPWFAAIRRSPMVFRDPRVVGRCGVNGRFAECSRIDRRARSFASRFCFSRQIPAPQRMGFIASVGLAHATETARLARAAAGRALFANRRFAEPGAETSVDPAGRRTARGSDAR